LKDDANPLGLEPYEGQAITELGIEIPGAAGGFREPLAVDETLIDMLKGVQHGDTIFAVFQLVKQKIRHEPAKDHDGWRRVDIFAVDGVGIVEAGLAEEAIREQRQRVQAALDAAEGKVPLFDNDGNPPTEEP
jgi:hypothetical protein